MRNQSLSDLCRNYNPQNWPYLNTLGDAVFTRECPALGALDDLYSFRGAASTWVQQQVTAMFIASEGRNAATANGITVFSENFAQVAAPYKLTELMLFFSQYAAGMYDDSYATFNARRIGVAFHKEFLPKRDQVLARIDREQRGRQNRMPAFAIGENEYRAAKDFHTQLLVIRDSEQLRRELGIAGGQGVNGRLDSYLPKEEIHRVHEYVRRGDVRIIKCEPIRAISVDLSKEKTIDDRLSCLKEKMALKLK